MPGLRFATANDLFAAFPTAAKDIGTPATNQAPHDYMKALAAAGKVMAAISFCAYFLDRQQATFWACQCVRGLPGPLAPEEMRALSAAEAWVQHPREPLRVAAHQVALRADHKSPATFAAYAAAFSGPGLMPPLPGAEAAPMIKVPSHATSQSVRAAFLLAGARLPPKKKEDYLRKWLAEGTRLSTV
jgi:hypothetical protein